jgi:uncharacterized protein DUF5343
MANELPYLPSYKNVGLLFEKIRTAKIPETFTQKFLYETIGLKGTGDRPLINLLKNLSFLDGAGKPTSKYSALKNEKIAGIEIARGVREAYKPLFDANEIAHTLIPNDLKGLVAQVSGADTNTTAKIVGTFKSLLAVSDFDSEEQLVEDDIITEAPKPSSQSEALLNIGKQGKGLRPEFHYNIQVHLPSNGTEETYMNIFNAVRKVFE